MQKISSNLKTKFNDAFASVFPIFVFVVLLSVVLAPLNASLMGKFLVSSVMLLVGMFLFTVGAESAMVPIGENIGSSLSKSRKLVVFVVCSLLLGFAVTIAEPSLAVLANQVANIDKFAFMVSVALGSAAFVALAVLRILFQVPMKTILFVGYGLVLAMMIFVPEQFLPVVFDAGGVTTGPVSTPFLLAFCIGVSAVRASKTSLEDSFGLIAIASIGPVLFVMLLSLFAGNVALATPTLYVAPALQTAAQVAANFASSFLSFMLEIGLIIGVIVAVFFIFQKFMLHLPSQKIKRILVGIGFTYLGIVVFLTGATVGYLPVANFLGYEVASNYPHWLLFPVVSLFGLCVVMAEPAIYVLIKQMYEVTGGTVSKRTLLAVLALSSALSMVLGVAKLLFDLPFIAIILPCYLLALLLCMITPQLFVSMAFDAGGVAAGTMAGCFLLPFALGVQPATNAAAHQSFGMIALIAVVPLITIQALGLHEVLKQKRRAKRLKLNVPQQKVNIVVFGE